MANTKQSKKRAKQSLKNNASNTTKISKMRTYIKKVNFAIKENNKNKAKEIFSKVQSILDNYYIKNIIHKNTASRFKKRISLGIKNIKEM